MIAWREDLNIGVQTVDAQHQELVRILNRFLEACTQQKGKEKIAETLDFLVDYTVKHFHDEEELMLTTNYPGYKEHKAEHEAFIHDVLQLKEKFNAEGASVLTTIKLNRSLVDWLLTHIQKKDQLLGEHIHHKHT